eukprot:492692_1
MMSIVNNRHKPSDYHIGISTVSRHSGSSPANTVSSELTHDYAYEVDSKSHVLLKLTKRKSGRYKTTYKTEIHLLRELRRCPYIVKLLNCSETDNEYELVLEHAPMSLENLLLQRCTKHPMQERVAKTIISQILKGIGVIHKLGFVHKNIRHEIVLIFSNRSERKLSAKLTDFGFATRVAPKASISPNNLPREFVKYLGYEENVRDRCGTPGFWAPELASNRYLCSLNYNKCTQDAFKMDVFSAGVTLYRMLCNEMPFGIFESWKYNIDHRDGQKKLCKVKPNWKVISWIQSDSKYTPVLSSRKLSDTVKDLLRSMLRIRPEQRAHVDECLKHHFFTNNKNNKKIQKSHKHHPSHHHQPTAQRKQNKRKKRSVHMTGDGSMSSSRDRKYRGISSKMKAN